MHNQDIFTPHPTEDDIDIIIFVKTVKATSSPAASRATCSCTYSLTCWEVPISVLVLGTQMSFDGSIKVNSPNVPPPPPLGHRYNQFLHHQSGKGRSQTEEKYRNPDDGISYILSKASPIFGSNLSESSVCVNNGGQGWLSPQM